MGLRDLFRIDTTPPAMAEPGSLRFLDAHGERWVSMRDLFQQVDLVIAASGVSHASKNTLRELKSQIGTASATAVAYD